MANVGTSHDNQNKRDAPELHLEWPSQRCDTLLNERFQFLIFNKFAHKKKNTFENFHYRLCRLMAKKVNSIHFRLNL